MNIDIDTELLKRAPSFLTHQRLRLAAKLLVDCVDFEEVEKVEEIAKIISEVAPQWVAALARREALRRAVEAVERTQH